MIVSMVSTDSVDDACKLSKFFLRTKNKSREDILVRGHSGYDSAFYEGCDQYCVNSSTNNWNRSIAL